MAARKTSRPGWTPEMLDFVKLERSQGMTAARIAAEIKIQFGIVFTRNAICGALDRIKKNSGLKPNKPKNRTPRRMILPKEVIVLPGNVYPIPAHHNRCASPGCNRQRADGYSMCLPHLPPLNLARSA